MGNNHGMTPEYISSAKEQAKAAFEWRWYVALKHLKALDLKWEEWYDACPEQTYGEMLPLIEARISILKGNLEFHNSLLHTSETNVQ